MTTSQRLAVAQSAVDRWNRKHKVGIPVMRYKFTSPLREGSATKTRSDAWVMGGRSAMIAVEGKTGGVLLESVVPIVDPPGNPLEADMR